MEARRFTKSKAESRKTPDVGKKARSNLRSMRLSHKHASQAYGEAVSSRWPESPHRRQHSKDSGKIAYRDAVCGLCEHIVSLALDIPLADLRAPTRSCADIALARQIAMYLANTSFNILRTEVGLYFRRDRTTVAHACALVEDKREDLSFDTLICQLEAALAQAVAALNVLEDICVLSPVEG